MSRCGGGGGVTQVTLTYGEGEIAELITEVRLVLDEHQRGHPHLAQQQLGRGALRRDMMMMMMMMQMAI